MDLSSGFDLPNAYGLKADDFDWDMDSYRAGLGFLGDVGCGVDEEKALADNGGSPHLLRSWEGSQRFRRVLGKVRRMGEEEREHAAAHAEQVEPSALSGRRFIPLEDAPLPRGLFQP
jgi:hypothetical protein